MDRPAALALILGAVAVLYAATQAQAALWEGGGADTPLDDGASPLDPYSPYTEPETMPINPQSAFDAMLAVIRQFESANRYDVLYGGQPIASLDRHPNTKVWFYDPTKPGGVGVPNNYTTAAGAYQFIYSTWEHFRRKLDLPDFSPASQDAAAAEYLRELGVEPFLAAGDVAGAFKRAGRAWASLPGSTAQQGPHSMADTLAAFNAAYIG